MHAQLTYLLHSGQLFGTERMAIATLSELSDRFNVCILAPEGPLHAEARRHGIRSTCFHGNADLVSHLGSMMACDRHGSFLTTSVAQAAAVSGLQALTASRGAHLHVVHGGTDERLSYGRKRLIQRGRIRFVAVSTFVKERLIAHGVQDSKIHVIENFIHDANRPCRPTFDHDGVRRVIMLSRLDRIKRVGLLFDALELVPGLDRLQFDVYGSGEEFNVLSERASRWRNVRLHGFDPLASERLSRADLLLHTCPDEPFGLALLEAFCAGVPVLAPNSGGASAILDAAQTGFRFAANNPVLMGRKLLEIADASCSKLNDMAERGKQALREHFRPDRLAHQYQALLEENT